MQKRSGKCEICGCADKSALHNHHIVPQCDPRSTNKPDNLVTVCANCHNKIHKKEIICEGWFASTEGSVFFWHLAGEEFKIREGIVFKEDGTVDILW